MPRFPAILRSLLPYALAIMAMAWPALAGADEVVVVISEDAAVYRDVAETIRHRLEGAETVRVVDASAFGGLKLIKTRFLVAVGSRAAQSVVAGHQEAPILVTLLPKSAIDHLVAEKRRATDTRPLSAVYLDQPIERQLNLIRLALPTAKRIGVLLGPESSRQLPALQAAAHDKKLDIAWHNVGNDKELPSALHRLLPDTDALLALPDPAVFNPDTIQPILLATYRQRLPLVGFSAAYTRAGAAISLYSTPAHIGDQAAEMLQNAMSKGGFTQPQYPRQFTVSINQHVARSLGLVIENEEWLVRRLKALDAR